MRKFISILLSLLLILNTLTTVFAVGTAITLQVDSNTINIGSRSVTIDTAPVIIDGRTLIPVRGVSEAMGGNVNCNNDTKTVTITLGSNKVEMTIDSKTAYFNNKAQILDVAPVVLNGRTMLPARFIAESFGFDVNWDNDTKTISITPRQETTTEITTVEESTETTTVEKTESDSKSLVVYFSKTGTTEKIANEIKDITGSDIVKIETVTPYPEDYNETVEIAQKEKTEKARPEIKITVDNLDEYDTIYIGYPIWWGTMPMAMFTFIENNNLDGKTLIPFSTHKGSGLGSSVSDLKTALPNSRIKDGLACNSSTTTAQIKNWIENSKK